jgi:hypothetical protein
MPGDGPALSMSRFEGGLVKLYYSKNLNPRVAVAVAQHLGSPVDYVWVSPREPVQEKAAA